MARHFAEFVMIWLLVTLTVARADEPLTLETASDPGANQAEEPLAEQFSPAAATRFLDAASLHWTKERKCFTCHTNYAYLMARPAVGVTDPAHQQIRDALEELVLQRWPEKGPRWDAEVVMSAAVLAFNDAATTGKLHPATKTSLDRMWTVQREDGGFDWLKCNWPPMESDDHFGATMALIGAGVAPQDYAQTETASQGIARLRDYLRHNPPPTLHHQAMLLWASTCLDGILSAPERKQTIDALLALQKEDGGWALASMGDWERSDKKQQDTSSSDGYATGFILYVLRRAGVAADHPQIQSGVSWLKANQRASGRWFTRSLNRDSRHYISHVGSAFALLALKECDQLPQHEK